eukprot:CAMPEP_0206314500 /NCGR_PEP_ID=MMETSP0106_2-20121207/15050_1 /ASSEMBLY_ACC=CAM_ASM_000206 /TAXON_ID=81532 /ORGANISM="Acanthoeca-like sp., Strain 10tr" /LENGTH=138 /DNA_ID=CAMNT_0053745859 /DNA_START=206 /DNA_END=619 /DNA_ORIENTATION=-
MYVTVGARNRVGAGRVWCGQHAGRYCHQRFFKILGLQAAALLHQCVIRLEVVEKARLHPHRRQLSRTIGQPLHAEVDERASGRVRGDRAIHSKLLLDPLEPVQELPPGGEEGQGIADRAGVGQPPLGNGALDTSHKAC